MTRRPMIGLVAVASPSSSRSPSSIRPCRRRPRRRAGRDRRRERQPVERPPPRPPAPTASARSQARALRLRAVLGDERRHRGAPGEDAADDARPLLGDAHQDRQDQHGADRLQADHRRDRQAAHPRGARPGRRRPARLHELRGRPERALLRVAGRSRTRPSPASSRWPTGSGRTASTSTSSRSASSSSRAYGCFVGPLARGACGRRTPTGWSRRRRRPAGPARAMAAGGQRSRCRPHLPDGLRLPLRGLRCRRVGADGPPRRRRAGPPLVARPVRVGRRARREDDPRAAALRDALAGGGSGARRATPRRRGDLGPGRQPEVPGRPTGAAGAGPDRDRRVLLGRPDGQPRARAIRARPRAGRRSTSIRRRPSSRSWPSPTTAAWPAPGSGRSGTNEGSRPTPN